MTEELNKDILLSNIENSEATSSDEEITIGGVSDSGAGILGYSTSGWAGSDSSVYHTRSLNETSLNAEINGYSYVTFNVINGPWNYTISCSECEGETVTGSAESVGCALFYTKELENAGLYIEDFLMELDNYDDALDYFLYDIENEYGISPICLANGESVTSSVSGTAYIDTPRSNYSADASADTSCGSELLLLFSTCGESDRASSRYCSLTLSICNKTWYQWYGTSGKKFFNRTYDSSYFSYASSFTIPSGYTGHVTLQAYGTEANYDGVMLSKAGTTITNKYSGGTLSSVYGGYTYDSSAYISGTGTITRDVSAGTYYVYYRCDNSGTGGYGSAYTAWAGYYYTTSVITLDKPTWVRDGGTGTTVYHLDEVSGTGAPQSYTVVSPAIPFYPGDTKVVDISTNGTESGYDGLVLIDTSMAGTTSGSISTAFSGHMYDSSSYVSGTAKKSYTISNPITATSIKYYYVAYRCNGSSIKGVRCYYQVTSKTAYIDISVGTALHRTWYNSVPSDKKYTLYRSDSSTGPWVRVGSVASTTASERQVYVPCTTSDASVYIKIDSSASTGYDTIPYVEPYSITTSYSNLMTLKLVSQTEKGGFVYAIKGTSSLLTAVTSYHFAAINSLPKDHYIAESTGGTTTIGRSSEDSSCWARSASTVLALKYYPTSTTYKSWTGLPPTTCSDGTYLTADEISVSLDNDDEYDFKNTEHTSDSSYLTFRIHVAYDDIEIVSTEYGTPSLSYTSWTAPDIPADGGTVTGSNSTISTVTYTQSVTYTYNTGDTSTATLTGTASGTLGGSVSGSDLGSTPTARTKKGQISYSVTINGKTATIYKDIYQAANYLVYDTGTWSVYALSYSTKSAVAATGGQSSMVPTQLQVYCDYYYTSGAAGAACIYSYSNSTGIVPGNAWNGSSLVKYSRTSTSSSSVDSAIDASTGKLTFAANKTTSARTSNNTSATLTISGSNFPSSPGSTSNWTLTVDFCNYDDTPGGGGWPCQSAGYYSYSAITISSFSYPTSAAHGSASATSTTTSPSVSYSQTYGWNGTTSGVGTITSGATLSYATVTDHSAATLDASTGVVTWTENQSSSSRSEKERVTVSLNGKTKTADASAYQSAGELSSWSSWVAAYKSISSTSNIDASGDTRTFTGYAYRTKGWNGRTSGASTDSDGSVNITTTVGSLSAATSTTSDTITLTVGNNTTTSTKSVKVTFTNSVSGSSTSYTWTQSAGSKSYSPWYSAVSASPTSVAKTGGDSSITAYSYRTWGWNSTSGGGTEYQSATLSTDLGTLSGTSAGSTSGSGKVNLTIPENKTASARTATITATAYSTGNTSTCTVSQAAGTKNYIAWTCAVSANPATGVAKTGGTSTITAYSYRTWGWNDSTTNGGTEYQSASLATNLGTLSAASAGSTSGSGTVTLTLAENKSTSAKTATITATAYSTGTTKTCTVAQIAGTKSYGTWYASVAANPTTGIAATGGDSSITAYSYRSWGWNDSSTNGGTVYQSATLSTDLGTLSATSAGSTSGAGTVKLTLAENKSTSAKTATVTATAYSSGNTATCTVGQTAGSKKYGTWYASVSANPTTEVAAGGGTSTITGYSYRSWGWNDSSTNGGTVYQSATIATDLGTLSTTSVGSTSGSGTSTLTLANNKTSSAKTATITATAYSSGNTSTCTVDQNAGYYSYSDVSISAFSISLKNAAAGTVSARITYDQTYGWNENTTELGSVTSGLSKSFAMTTGNGASINTSTGAVTWEANRHDNSTSGAKRYSNTITATVTGNGSKSATRDTSACQSGDLAGTSYGTPYNITITCSDVPAAGGSVTSGTASATTCKQTRYWRSGYYDTVKPSYTSSWSGGATDISSLTDVSTARTDLGTSCKLVLTYTANSVSATTDCSVYQAQNKIESWDNPKGLSFTVSTIPASGGTVSSGTISTGSAGSGKCWIAANYTSGSAKDWAESYTGSWGTAVTASTLDTSVTPYRKVGTLTYTYTVRSKSTTASTDVYQAANEFLGYEYDNITGISASSTLVPAKGGTITTSMGSLPGTATQVRYYCYTAGHRLSHDTVDSTYTGSWKITNSSGTTVSSPTITTRGTTEDSANTDTGYNLVYTYTSDLEDHAGNKQSGTWSVDVYQTRNEVTKITTSLSPSSIKKNVRSTDSYTSTASSVATLTDGSTKTVTSSTTYESSNTGVATVSSNVATSVAVGTATITGTYAGVSGGATLTVTDRFLLYFKNAAGTWTKASSVWKKVNGSWVQQSNDDWPTVFGTTNETPGWLADYSGGGYEYGGEA